MWKKETFIGIIVVLLAIGLLTQNYEKNKEKEDQLQEYEQKLAYSVNYSEDGEDKNYNYIINPQALTDTSLNIESCTRLNDDVNELFTTKGIKNSKLKITDITQKGSVITFNVIAEQDNNTFVIVQYDEKNTDLTTILAEN